MMKSNNSINLLTGIKIAGLLFILWCLFSFASYTLLARTNQQKFDFYPRWVGSRAILQGENPYSEEITLQIQQGMFGRHLNPDEDQQRFAYTPFVTWLLIPFWLIPFPIAISFWTGLQFLLLLILPLMFVSLFRWQISPLLLFTLIVFSIVIYRYPIIAYVLGQFIPFSLACIVVALWGMMKDHQIIASIALIFAMIRPEVVVIPVTIILVIAWSNRQFKLITTWLLGMAFLWLLSHLWIGLWEIDFVNGIFAYNEYSHPQWPPGLIKIPWISAIIVLGILSWAIWMWQELRNFPHFTRPVWLVSMAILVSLLLIPQTGNYTLVLGLIPIWLLLYCANDHPLWKLPILLVILSPWVFHYFVNYSSFEHLILPVTLLILLGFYLKFWKKALFSGALEQQGSYKD